MILSTLIELNSILIFHHRHSNLLEEFDWKPKYVVDAKVDYQKWSDFPRVALLADARDEKANVTQMLSTLADGVKELYDGVHWITKDLAFLRQTNNVIFLTKREDFDRQNLSFNYISNHANSFVLRMSGVKCVASRPNPFAKNVLKSTCEEANTGQLALAGHNLTLIAIEYGSRVIGKKNYHSNAPSDTTGTHVLAFDAISKTLNMDFTTIVIRNAGGYGNFLQEG